MANFLILHGPNLNLLGSREPETYGSTTLSEINSGLEAQAKAKGHVVSCLQSNVEHELIDAVQEAPQNSVDCIVLNPAGYTHTSVALRDALLAIKLPFVEVHLSNIHQREEFRHYSYFSDIALGVISGFGAYGYTLALEASMNFINTF